MGARRAGTDGGGAETAGCFCCGSGAGAETAGCFGCSSGAGAETAGCFGCSSGAGAETAGCFGCSSGAGASCCWQGPGAAGLLGGRGGLPAACHRSICEGVMRHRFPLLSSNSRTGSCFGCGLCSGGTAAGGLTECALPADETGAGGAFTGAAGGASGTRLAARRCILRCETQTAVRMTPRRTPPTKAAVSGTPETASAQERMMTEQIAMTTKSVMKNHRATIYLPIR